MKHIATNPSKEWDGILPALCKKMANELKGTVAKEVGRENLLEIEMTSLKLTTVFPVRENYAPPSPPPVAFKFSKH